MASKPISVKVRTEKVLAALKKARDQRVKAIADNDKRWDDYDKAEQEFYDTLAEMFRSGKGKIVNTHSHHGWRNENKYDFTVEFPPSVKKPKEPKGNRTDWSAKAELEELENAIALLEMTDEEFVSTSTYKGVARFIK